MQLDLLMQSINDNLKGIKKDIHILYRHTNSSYQAGYSKFYEKWCEFDKFYFYLETGKICGDMSFKENVLNISNSFIYSYTLCLLDDDVIINPITKNEFIKGIEHLNNRNHINALSCRMGWNIERCYPKDCPMEKPQPLASVDDIFMMWDWTDCLNTIDWGYPMSLGGNIYRQKELNDLWHGIEFDSPNYIEGNMHLNRPSQKRPYQLSFKSQRIYNVANNLVQIVCENRFEHTVENEPNVLNRKWLNGHVIDKNKLYGKVFDSANGPAEYQLIKGEK